MTPVKERGLLAPVYAVAVTTRDGVRYVPRSQAAFTPNMPMLWASKRDAERRAKRETERGLQGVRVVEFTLAPPVAAPPSGPTVRVRIPVARDALGRWAALAWGTLEGLGDSEVALANEAWSMMPEGAEGSGVIWVEASVPLPSEAVVEGEVTSE